MAIVDSNEYDLVQLWGLITELSEQLSQNRSLSVSLYSLAGNVKVSRLAFFIKQLVFFCFYILLTTFFGWKDGCYTFADGICPPEVRFSLTRALWFEELTSCHTA